MTVSYTPSAWYWVVAGSVTQVYSSAAVAYVPVANAGYVAWKAAGGLPTKIATEQELWDVLAAAGQPLPGGASESDTSKAARISTVNIVIARILLNHENRIRTLEGNQAITMQQFVNGVRALL